ncbi:MAG: methyltransferase [Myxococcales bacterium]|nr:methyltransferase [Myxococcales bacterium]
MNAEAPHGWPADAVRDRLVGDWHIYQRKGGHRTSTDDLITAWYAVHRAAGRPSRYLDLGCGVGSVLLMVCHKLRPQLAYGVEAQAESVMMARRAVGELPSQPCEILIEHADFRAADRNDEGCDLVTGSPPYFPLHTGVLPADAQRRACRFEERGGVEDYLSAAARALSPDGRFYLVFQTAGGARVLAAAAEQALHVTGQADFFMRSDRLEAFLSVFELSRRDVPSPHQFQCAVRDADGEVSAEYQAIRRELLGPDLEPSRG